MLKIAIIGGGPAGFMAAIAAVENTGKEIAIDIYDKSHPLKTILCTGNGRCNLTNKIYNFKELALNYPRGEKFLYSVFSRFGVKDTIEWFENHGLQLYTQDDNRVFPQSNDANTVRNVLIDEVNKLGIRIKSHASVLNIDFCNNKFILSVDKSNFTYDRVIIATGGNHRKLESSGYAFAENLGHKVTDLKQALCGLVSLEKWPVELAGVSIKNVQISAFIDNTQITSANGDFVFTHDGISGPLAFKISSYCAFEEYTKSKPLNLKINFVSSMSDSELEKEILNELDKNSKKSLINILKEYIPRSVALELLNNAGLDSEKKASQVSKEDRKVIIKILTRTELNIKSPKPDGEIVTAGGVELDEVNPKTMESKLVKGLYFCGEVLNIDGLTGGFNLQACWSTGYVAGLNVIKD